MPLSTGRKLGTYEILSAIGAGGMGEVYQAHDTKLGRDVAIKVLPEVFAHDADRLSRFEREAKLLASLNHPNIATIHGLEKSNGTHYLVMELVSGENLAERVKREGAAPVEESLTIAKQIAEALEAAHAIRTLLSRCLRKGRRQRLPDAGAARIEIEEAIAVPATTLSSSASRGAQAYRAPSPGSTALRHRPVRKFPLTLRGLQSKRTGTSLTKESSSVLRECVVSKRMSETGIRGGDFDSGG